MSNYAFLDTTSGEQPVRGLLHRASGSGTDVLLLTHGAGATCEAPLLVALANTFAANGLSVLRYDLPFRQRRSTGPPRPGEAEFDREGIRRAGVLLRRMFAGRVFLGGQSYGGRQSSMLAASDPMVANGLLLLSYPLHPPRRPVQQRVSHLPALRISALFIHGTRDPFGSIEELQSALKLISVPVHLLPVGGAGHDLLTKHNRDELPGAIAKAFKSFFYSSSN